MLRGLIHAWRLNAAVALAAAVATSVLTGALVVGDSVRGSLRALTLERLGRVETALEAPRFLDTSLAGEEAVPIIRVAASARHAASGRRAASVQVHGIDGRFLDLFPGAGGEPLRQAAEARPGFALRRPEGSLFPPVALNASLAAELGAVPGDEVLVSFQRPGEIPRDSLLGRRDPEDVTGRARLTVAAVVPDAGAGRFHLSPHQAVPLNAFLALQELQRLLEQPGRANALLLPEGAVGPGVDGAEAWMRGRLRPGDLGLRLRPAGDVVAVESAEMVLRPVVERAVVRAAEDAGLAWRGVQTYLANAIRLRDRSVPYSVVAALDTARWEPPFPVLELAGGGAAPALGDGEILLNTWAAEDLQARAGDVVELDYFVIGPREELSEATTSFRVAGVVAMTGLAADPGLTPEYPGISDAGDISAWDPPFPVDLAAVGPRDEAYWDTFRATPKAFAATATGAHLWSTRHGTLTSVRLAAGPGEGGAEAAAGGFTRALMQQVDLRTFGLEWRPVRAQGLEAAAGATDFTGLFLGFSFFLILSAALLVGLLFRLGVERRVAEVGLLLALGYRLRQVRLRLLGEGGVLALAGAAAGTAGGIGYAALLLHGLRTWWRPAVGSSELHLHLQPASLAAGAVISLLVVLITIWMAARRLARLPVPALLAGEVRPTGPPGPGRLARLIAAGGLALAVSLAAAAWLGGQVESPGLSFGTGAALLASGLGAFAAWCRRRRSASAAAGGLIRMAARSSAWNPGRSILSLALVASASFVIVLVAANRHDPGAEAASRDGGSGGFTLLAESSVPLYQDLNREEDRRALGLDEEAEAALAGARFYPFRLLGGSDASCLNLYRPGRPRLLGVPPEMLQRGGFRFAASQPPVDDPWRLLDQDLGEGVIPALGDASSVRWILHLGLGQELELEDGQGETVRLRLVGLLDRSLFQSELLVAEDRLLSHFPGVGGYQYFLVDVAPERAEAAATALEAGLSRFGVDAVPTLERLAAFQAVENTYLSTFEALGGLGLLLGTVGLGIVLLRNVLERRRELATLRAFGFRRRRLAGLVLAENAFLLAAGIALGAGSALAASAPRLAAGQVHLPWGSLAATMAAVLAVGMLASLLAVRGALGVPLLPVLKADR